MMDFDPNHSTTDVFANQHLGDDETDGEGKDIDLLTNTSSDLWDE